MNLIKTYAIIKLTFLFHIISKFYDKLIDIPTSIFRKNLIYLYEIRIIKR